MTDPYAVAATSPSGITAPTVDQFRELANDRSLIPVVRRFLVDDQTPAIGAHVWLFGGGSVLRSARQAGRTLETWTDTSGRFALFDVPADRGVTVRAKLRDQEADPYRLPDDASGDGILLVLAPTSIVSGRVLDQRTGQPIDRAAVYLRPGKVGPGGRNQYRVNTNAEGRYTIYSVLPGEWTIFADMP